MGLVVSITGTLNASQAQSTDGQFPSGSTSIPFQLNPNPKSYNTNTDGVINVNSPSAFVAIPGIGGSVGPVTQALLLYGRVTSPMQFRLTYSGDGTAKVMYVGGFFVIEVDPTHPVTLFEVQGSGQLEFWASGQQ